MTLISEWLLMDEGLIEIVETLILIFVLARCVKFTAQTNVHRGGYFWLAVVFIVLVLMRREMSFLMNFDNVKIFGYNYDAIEDSILFAMYVVILGELIYARTYFIQVLKIVSKETYLSIIILMEIQYIGEHLHLVFIPHWVGFLMEELSENIVYLIVLSHLWTFNLAYFEDKLVANTKANYHYLRTKS